MSRKRSRNVRRERRTRARNWRLGGGTTTAVVGLFLALAIVGGFLIYNRRALRNRALWRNANAKNVKNRRAPRGDFARKLSRIFAVVAVAATLVLGAGFFASETPASAKVADCGASTNSGSANGGNGANSGTNPGTNPAPLGPVSAKDVSFKPTSAMFAGAKVTDAGGSPSDMTVDQLLAGIPADSPFKTGFGIRWDSDGNPVFYVDDGQLERNIPCDWDCNDDGVVDSHDVYTEWQDGDNKAIIPSISLPVVGDETRLDKITVDLDPSTPGVQQTVYVIYNYATAGSTNAMKYTYNPATDQVVITPLNSNWDWWNSLMGDKVDQYNNEWNQFYSDYQSAHDGNYPSDAEYVAWDNQFYAANNIDIHEVNGIIESESAVQDANLYSANFVLPYSVKTIDGAQTLTGAGVYLPVVYAAHSVY